MKNYLLKNDGSCYIIAEAGVNHNGSIDLAYKLIDEAVKAKVDAIKFQTFIAEKIVTKDASKATYQKKNTNNNNSQFEMLKKLELSYEETKKIFEYAKKKGITFISTPFDEESVDFLDELEIPFFKIASGEITNIPLLEKIARKRKPIVLSTGMASIGEIEYALSVLRKNGATQIILLQCTTNYPASFDTLNLKTIQTMKSTFGLNIGYSDHSEGIIAPIAAVALGACVIEKHFTLDKNLPGPDHKASLNPDELKRMVEGIRNIERALGNGIKTPSKEEIEIRKFARKSIVAKVNILKEQEIKKDMLVIKRPGTGIEPKYIDLIIGRKAKKTIEKGTLLKWEYF